MHILIYLMDSLDAAERMEPVVSMARRGGHSVQIMMPSLDGGFPGALFDDPEVMHTPLCVGGLDHLPRVSHEEYVERYGDDIDWARIQIHEAFVDGLPVSRERLFLDAMHTQRLRGFASLIAEHVRVRRPDAAIVHQTSGLHPKIALAKFRGAGIPTLIWDTPFFPDRVLLDSGMHFYPGQSLLASLHAQAQPLDADLAAEVETRLEAWKAAGVSKYRQPVGEVETTLLEEIRASGTRVLFMPGQVPWDASVIHGLGDRMDLASIQRGVREAVPEGWTLVFKPHPMDPVDTRPSGREGERVVTVRDADVHTLLRMSDAVVTHSSNVGFEALLFGVPVLVTGRPHYHRLGLTGGLDDPANLGPALAALASPSREQVLALFHRVRDVYLLDPCRPELLEARFEAAAEPPATDPRAPYTESYPVRAQAWAALAATYSELCDTNQGPDEILDHPRLELFQANFGEGLAEGRVVPDELRSGERQVALHVEDVAPDHLTRYRLAERILEQEGARRILDFACGTGYGTGILAAREGATAHGVDVSSDAISFAMRKWGTQTCTFTCASAGGWKTDTRFDAVVTFETVEHLPNARAFLQAMWATLEEGGLLLLSVPDATGYALTDNPYHIRHYREGSLRALLACLPEVGGLTLCQQVSETRVEAGVGGRFLLAVLRKGTTKPAVDLGDLLPFDCARPAPPGVVRFDALDLNVHDERLREGGMLVFSDEVRETLGIEHRLVCFGPYCAVSEGRWQLDVHVEEPGMPWRRPKSRLHLEVRAGWGTQPIAHTVEGTELEHTKGRYSLVFDLREPVQGFEVLIHHRRREIRVHGWELRRLDTGS